MDPLKISRERTTQVSIPNIKIRSPGKRHKGFPDFFILGPQRTGTTWLYHNLRGHPSVFLPDCKETYYFSTLGNPSHPHFRYPHLEDYLAAFREPLRRRIKKHYDCLCKHGRLYLPFRKGDATASHATIAPEIIEQLVAIHPGVRGIIMLRDPIERIWSHARKELLRKTPDGMVSDKDYLRFFARGGQRKNSDYRSIISNWEARLQPGHLFLGDYRLIASDPETFWKQVCHFLQIDPLNICRTPHFHGRINPAPSSPIPKHLRQHLEKELAEEIAFFPEALRRAATEFHYG